VVVDLSRGLLEACDDKRLFDFALWDRQRELLEAVEKGPRIHVWALGRRSGKTTMSALACLWDCVLRPSLDERVRQGETRYAVAIATNLSQSRLIVQAAKSVVQRSRALSALVEGTTEDEIRFLLPTGARTCLRAFPCSSRGGRGWPISSLVMDELAFFLSESDGFQTGERVWQALGPSTAQFGSDARVLMMSTPYGTSGLFAEMWARADAGELADALAQHATTAQMNPTISSEFFELEEARDPDSFRSEFEAVFESSGDAFIDFARVGADRVPVARPEDGVGWVCGLDPAFSKDPFGVALLGRAKDGVGFVVGPVKGLRPEGEFAGVIDEVARLAKEYGVGKLITDQFCSVATVEQLKRKHALHVVVNNMTAASKTAIFQELRGRIYDQSLPLPENPGLIAELMRLRTRFSAGSASIVNPRVGGSHGDMAQALAMAAYELSTHVGVAGGPILLRRDSPRAALQEKADGGNWAGPGKLARSMGSSSEQPARAGSFANAGAPATPPPSGKVESWADVREEIKARYPQRHIAVQVEEETREQERKPRRPRPRRPSRWAGLGPDGRLR
jgi:hypothetical protein